MRATKLARNTRVTGADGSSVLRVFLRRKSVRISPCFRYQTETMRMLRLDQEELQAQDPVAMAATADCVVIITNHTKMPYAEVLERASLVVDTRNVLKGITSDKIVRL